MMIKKRTDTKRRPARYFNILIVPEGSNDIRRLKLTRLALKFGAGLLGGIFLLVCATVVSLFIYRNAYISTENVRVEAAKFTTERTGLLNRIAELEGALSRVERFAVKIASAVNGKGVTPAGSMKAQGPVDEEAWLPSADVVSDTRGVTLGSNLWRSPFSKSLGKDLKLALDDLSDRIDDTEEKVHTVFALQRDKLHFWASLPTVWPARGWITSDFGDRRSRHHRGRIHEGIDIAAPRGTPIMAPGSGVVTYVGYRRGYGNVLVLDHGYGISTLYAHCQMLYVSEGQSIKRGMLIASVGNTGRSTGPHLHYEVHLDGVPVNPLLYVVQDL